MFVSFRNPEMENMSANGLSQTVTRSHPQNVSFVEKRFRCVMRHLHVRRTIRNINEPDDDKHTLASVFG